MSEYDKLKKILSANIRGLMRLYSIDTYSDLCQLLDIDITPSGVSNYVTGRLGRVEVLAAIADAFCISTADLVTDGFAESALTQAVEKLKRTQNLPSTMTEPVDITEEVTEIVPPSYVSDYDSVSELDVPQESGPKPSIIKMNPESRSTLLYLLNDAGISVSQVRDSLELSSSQPLYNFMGLKGPVSERNRFIAVYLSMVLNMSITEIGQLRGRKGPLSS